MNNSSSPDQPAGNAARPAVVKIFGVGSAGLAVLERIGKGIAPGAVLCAVGANEDSLAASSAPEKICLETRLLRGLGTGGDPERGRALAEENLSKLQAACAGVDAVFILTGLGGGAGTGISPVLARVAREAGALVLAFVTLPFDCEGNRRLMLARHGLEQLKNEADGVVCLPNQKIFKLIDENTSVLDTFKLTSELLADGVAGVWRLIARKGLIEIHFADLCALLRDRHGESVFATAEAAGATRSREVVDKLLSHPMLNGGKTMSEADAVLVSLIGGPDLTMAEVNRVMEHINGKCSRAQVVMGAAIDESFQERLAITLVAARKGESRTPKNSASETSGSKDLTGGELFQETPSERTHSRFVPPPPSLTPEKVEQIIVRQGTGNSRARKTASKMRQGQLPLEIVSKGRFDKSEPTIHKGEDLDVPTYIRRGVSLN